MKEIFQVKSIIKEIDNCEKYNISREDAVRLATIVDESFYYLQYELSGYDDDLDYQITLLNMYYHMTFYDASLFAVQDDLDKFYDEQNKYFNDDQDWEYFMDNCYKHVVDQLMYEVEMKFP